jgi:hypothetical protein
MPTGGTGGTTPMGGTGGTTPTGNRRHAADGGTGGSTPTGGNPDGRHHDDATGVHGEATEWLPKGTTQLANLARAATSTPLEGLCGSTPPTINSMDDVLKVLGLSFGPGPYPERGPAASAGIPPSS